MRLIKNKKLIRIVNIIFVFSLSTLFGCGGGAGGASQTSSTIDGKGGSMSRFSLIGDYLYAISGRDMQLFDIATVPGTAALHARVSVGWDIETLYSTNTHIFIGAENGVYIFDNSIPSNPFQVSKFLHVQSCDPVVVNNNYAYITLRDGGGRCRQGVNRMEVLDISDINYPRLIKTVVMQNPKGLGVQDGLLFVCDGNAGLKTYSLADPKNPIIITTDVKINCYDLIPYKINTGNSNNNVNGNLVVSDNSGIVQFKYDITGLTKLSSLLVTSPQGNSASK